MVSVVNTETGERYTRVAHYFNDGIGGRWTGIGGDNVVTAFAPMSFPSPYEHEWEKASGRCSWVSGDGRQCELPNAHVGEHRGSRLFDWSAAEQAEVQK